MRPPAAAAAAAETPPAFRPAPLHPSPSRDLAALAPARRAAPIESESGRAREGAGEDEPLLAGQYLPCPVFAVRLKSGAVRLVRA